MTTPKNITIALAGNPNTGKTTLFNLLTGGHQQVGNWSGVTVERKDGHFIHDGINFAVVDLPGTYSLSPFTPEERVARDFIARGESDVVVQVIDSGNLERNLYLSTLLIEAGAKVVYALNMADEAEERGLDIDLKVFSQLMGGPAVWTSGVKNRGMQDLIHACIYAAKTPDIATRHLHISYGTDGENAVEQLCVKLHQLTPHLLERFHDRWLAVRLLEKDDDARKLVTVAEDKHRDVLIAEADRLASWLEDRLQQPVADFFTERRYAFVHGVLAESATQKEQENRPDLTAVLDAVFLNKVLGFPLFALIFFLVFQATFGLGAIPMGWIDSGVAWVAQWVAATIPVGWYNDFLVDGIIGGVGFVLVFVPSIMILFFFIALLEDSGYMSRVAFIVDPVMHLLKLHGKSIIPLIMGFGCNVPGIMATRTLESRRDRIVTALIIPYMSCAARLPIYIVFGGAFFAGAVWGISLSGLVTFFLYLLGVAVALIMGRIISFLFFRSDSDPFVMELPPYRIPALKTLVYHMWDRSFVFIRRMGTVILFGSIAIWVLSNVPGATQKDKEQADRMVKQAFGTYAAAVVKPFKTYKIDLADPFSTPRFEHMYRQIHDIEDAYARDMAATTAPARRTEIDSLKKGEVLKLRSIDEYAYRMVRLYDKALKQRHRDVAAAEKFLAEKRLEHSVLGHIGHFLAPTLAPLGFTWKEAIALLSGLVAKEIVVSTYGIMYQIGSDVTEDDPSLVEAIQTSGMDRATAFGFMVFVLLYMPCLGTLAALRRETNSLRWPLFSVVSSSVVAWVISFLAVHVARLM